MKIALLLMVVVLSQACEHAADYHYPTVAEQTNSANYVVEGTVIEELWDVETLTGTSVIEVTKYHKGCGPATVTVSGYSDPDFCGVKMGATGSTVVTFGCLVSGTELRVNNVGVWTGEVDGTDDVRTELESLGLVNECPEVSEELSSSFTQECDTLVGGTEANAGEGDAGELEATMEEEAAAGEAAAEPAAEEAPAAEEKKED